MLAGITIRVYIKGCYHYITFVALSSPRIEDDTVTNAHAGAAVLGASSLPPNLQAALNVSSGEGVVS
jgi:hypothetical protein